MNPVNNFSEMQELIQNAKKLKEFVDTVNFVRYNYGEEVDYLYRFSMELGYLDPYEFILSNNLLDKSLDEIKILWALYTNE